MGQAAGAADHVATSKIQERFMGRLNGKVILLTGGATGLGAEQAVACSREGAKVVFGDIADEEGAKVEARVRETGEAMYIHLDVTSEQDWQAAVEAAAARFGKLNVLINNAGIAIKKVSIEERTAAEWDRVMAVNLRGVFLGTKHAIPHLRRAGGGSIVNVSSIAGIGQSQIQEPAYATSKAAVRMLSRVTATQYAHEGIRCNSLHPGPTDGGMLYRFLPDTEALKQRLKRVPMGRLARVEEIVAGIIFLAADESSYMTGAELVIDGGALAQ
jgi:NAD(P)-dependent dehydrogenase (short-subunit alcohol dehydrogenase family)